jgi:hypothetical protein
MRSGHHADAGADRGGCHRAARRRHQPFHRLFNLAVGSPLSLFAEGEHTRTTNLLNWTHGPHPPPIHPRIQRRRDLDASLHIPPELGKFTAGEHAVLKIVSGEVVTHGACTLTKDAIADLSSVSSIVVKVALRTATAEGLIAVERTGRRNTITLSAKWKAWLDRFGDAPPDGPR